MSEVRTALPKVKRLSKKKSLAAGGPSAYLLRMEQKAPGRACAAFGAAMEVLGRPWNGMLLHALEDGPLRFSALAERIAIGDRMLSCRLKELEAGGLVERSVDPGPPVKVSYALTELGRGLGAVSRAVEAWGERLLDERPEVCAGAVCEDPDGR